MEKNYDKIKKQCIRWIYQNGPQGVKSFPSTNSSSPEYYNEVAEFCGKGSSFNRFDLVQMGKKDPEKIMLITKKSFQPKNNSDALEDIFGGIWKYSGYAIKTKNNKIKYEITPYFPEKSLKKII
jgi:hypothetical protein